MKYLFDEWDKLKKALDDKIVLLNLDYDGTLTPIAATPEEAVLSPEVKAVLEELTRLSDCELAVISGRALEDIRSMVGLKNIVYVGNHGFEIDGPRIHFESLTPPDIRKIFAKIKEDLAKNFAKLEGVIIEDKGLTLSVHYRLVPEKMTGSVTKTFQRICRPYLKKKQIKVGSGKKVLEIKPPIEWDKGKAVLWLLAQQARAGGKNRVFPIYIGDDRTDEDVFLTLKKNGVTVFVGQNGRSAARYYVKNTAEVLRFLRLLRDFQKEAAHA
ncbi:MAG: trehalose-phosphatase [Candidatus Omnitrophica bacterium]|nr:trehalose-phosphatase [Candidatus Omnitrophota bacterium]